jgi:predicted RNA-binding Zn-ribbon protein involved in translation (DUF1610 family)
VVFDHLPRYVGSAGTVVCPRCGGSVQRIRRRWIDRMLSAFAPLRRYRCHSPRCGWEGNEAERR